MADNEKLLQGINSLLRIQASGAAYPPVPNLAVQFLEQASDRLNEAMDIMRQAQSCLLGETPEDCTFGEAEDDTLTRIRGFLNGSGAYLSDRSASVAARDT